MSDPAVRYLDLMKKCLTHALWPETAPFDPQRTKPSRRLFWTALSRFLARRELQIRRVVPYDYGRREEGRDWPAIADTMIGLKRLDNIQDCVEDVLRSRVPGDLIETGVWRGGATIFMRAILEAHGVRDRRVWVADSFEGVPLPAPLRYPADRDDTLFTYKELAVPLETVKANFAKYGLLDNQVRFLQGWFRDTLPTAPITQLAVARLDGDLYESTFDALQYLYPKVSVGGYVIVDDYAYLPGCRQAVDDFRKGIGITDELKHVDWSAVYWQRS
jgi:O-methyltransferase